jgi:hypothetical protein
LVSTFTGFDVIEKIKCRTTFNVKLIVISTLTNRGAFIHINIEPIGIIKKAGKYSEILIYSDFEQIVKNTVSQLGKNIESSQNLLIIHKNNDQKDGHQVQVTKTVDNISLNHSSLPLYGEEGASGFHSPNQRQ